MVAGGIAESDDSGNQIGDSCHKDFRGTLGLFQVLISNCCLVVNRWAATSSSDVITPTPASTV